MKLIPLAIVGNFGGGILFLLLVLIWAAATLVWILVWLICGFRSKGWENPNRPRRLAFLLLLATVAAMLTFPPHRRRGEWVDAVSGTPLPRERANGHDRRFFGYIPSYHLIGIEARQRHDMSALATKAGETYKIVSSRLRVDWVFLTMQLVFVTLLALPYLRAVTRPEDLAVLRTKPFS